MMSRYYGSRALRYDTSVRTAHAIFSSLQPCSYRRMPVLILTSSLTALMRSRLISCRFVRVGAAKLDSDSDMQSTPTPDRERHAANHLQSDLGADLLQGG